MSEANPVIRTMLRQDLDLVFNMEQHCHIAPWPKKIFNGCLLLNYDCRVFDINSTIIGYLIARIEDESYHILNFCIDKPYQNKGFGKKILLFILDFLKDKEQYFVILEVRPSNKTAIKLYQSLGFQEVGLKENYYSDEMGVEDAIVLKKLLKPE